MLDHDEVPLALRIQVLQNVTFAVGLWLVRSLRLCVFSVLLYRIFLQLAMGIFRLGHLAVLLSDHLIRGFVKSNCETEILYIYIFHYSRFIFRFTCAGAFHVFTVQLKTILGLKLPGRYGPFNLIYASVL